MAPAVPAERIGLYTGLDLRRSKRLHRAVRLMILGQDREGQPYREKMSTVNLSLHGCCYQSWHNSQIDAKVELQVTEGLMERPALVHARVRHVRPPLHHSELFQIGVEFDSPQTGWLSPQEETVAGTAPHGTPKLRTAGKPEAKLPAASPPELTQQECALVERVTTTIDRLTAALQGPVQRAASNAAEAVRAQLEETLKGGIQQEVATQLDEAVRHSLWMIEEISSANARKAESSMHQRVEQMIRSSEERVVRQLEARFTELSNQLEDQQKDLHQLSGELVAPLEEPGAETRREGKESQATTMRIAGREPEQLIENPAAVTPETSTQSDACRIEATALQSMASQALEQFRQQLELQVDLAISEMKQRLSASLAALEAENHIACDSRRKLFEDDLAQATEKAAEQFRSGIKAHLYNSLVAAIEAVDKHANTALTTLLRGPR